MRIKPPQKSKKKIIIASLLILALVLGAGLYAYIFRPLSSESTNNSKKSTNSNETKSTNGSAYSSDKAKKEPGNSDTNTKTPTPSIEKEKGILPQYEGADEITDETVSDERFRIPEDEL